VHKQGN